MNKLSKIAIVYALASMVHATHPAQQLMLRPTLSTLKCLTAKIGAPKNLVMAAASAGMGFLGWLAWRQFYPAYQESNALYLESRRNALKKTVLNLAFQAAANEQKDAQEQQESDGGRPQSIHDFWSQYKSSTDISYEDRIRMIRSEIPVEFSLSKDSSIYSATNRTTIIRTEYLTIPTLQEQIFKKTGIKPAQQHIQIFDRSAKQTTTLLSNSIVPLTRLHLIIRVSKS